MKEDGTVIIIFFTIPTLLIEVIVFVLGAIVFQPIDHAKEACIHIENWSNSHTPIMLIIFAVISVLISLIVKGNIGDRIINIPAFFTGIYLIYSLILFGLCDMLRTLDGMWFLFALFFCAIWIILVFIFILLAVLGTLVPCLVGQIIKGNIARYITTGVISTIVSIVMFGFSAMFATEYWKPLGNIFISIFGK